MVNWNSPKKAVIIANNRCGGTALCHSLDSHYQIRCMRSEPLHGRGALRKYGLKTSDILHIVLSEAGYHVNICKINFSAFDDDVFRFLNKYNLPIIHLDRINLLHAVLSNHINIELKNNSKYSTHRFTQRPNELYPIHLEPEKTKELYQKALKEREQTENYLSRLDNKIIRLKYRDLFGERKGDLTYLAKETSDKLNAFLEVENIPLFTQTQKVNPPEVSDMVSNYDEIEKYLNI